MKNQKYAAFIYRIALFFLLLTAFLTAATATNYLEAAELQAASTTQIAQSESGPTLWTIDTQTASYRRGTPLAEAGVRVLKKVDGCWQDTSRAELASVDEPIPLVVFFHGMWLNQTGGRKEAMRLYRLLERDASGRPFQFVIWSWPARRSQCGARKDVRAKVCRTDTQAFYVAQWLETLPENRPICMVGYSLGARIVSGSLELLAGGTVGGQSLQGDGSQDEVRVLKGPHEVDATGKASPCRPIRAVLVAAAIDSGSFAPGHRNGLTLTQVERLLVTRNRYDKVLRWYPALYRIGGPKAMGSIGPTCRSRLGEEGDRLDVLPVSCSVGRNHYWKSYLRSCALQGELLESTFGPAVETAPVTAKE